MEITLEKIDLVKERTGVSYKQAKEALEAAEGDVVEAIIAIEESSCCCCGDDKGANWTETINAKGTEVVDKLKELVKKGNVSRIRVKKDNLTILDIPVTAGAFAIFIPQFAAVGAAVALLTKCTIEVERPEKETIYVNEVIASKAEEMTEMVKNKVEDIKEDLKDRFGDKKE